MNDISISMANNQVSGTTAKIEASEKTNYDIPSNISVKDISIEGNLLHYGSKSINIKYYTPVVKGKSSKASALRNRISKLISNPVKTSVKTIQKDKQKETQKRNIKGMKQQEKAKEYMVSLTDKQYLQFVLNTIKQRQANKED